MNTLHIPHIQGPPKEGCQAAEASRTLNLATLNLVEIIARTWMLTPALHLEKWPKRRMRKWKYEHNIRFVASNSAKLTIKFLNSEKVEI